MSIISANFGIKEALKQLGVKSINEGTSTGSNNFSNGDVLESYSPVDGQLIGKVATTTKEDYEKVFSFFTTLGKKDRFENTGTGIGLSTVQKMVHKLDGRIELESEIGKGSTFTLYFKK